MSAGAERFLQSSLGRPGTDDGLDDDPATVTAVTSGVVTVRHLGRDIKMPRLESYTSPAVGHQVVVRRVGGRWYVLGRLTGFPT